MRRLLNWALLMACAGCGPTPNDAGPRVSLMFPDTFELAYACPEVAAIHASMTTDLRIGGEHPDCPLTVDPSTGASTGTCPSILFGTTWPLMAVHRYAGASDPRIIAYRVGFVRLCDDPGDVDVVEVELAGADALLITEPEEMENLPAEGTSPPSCSDGLLEAQRWARGQIEEKDGSGAHPLNADNDGASNMQEACNGTLN